MSKMFRVLVMSACLTVLVAAGESLAGRRGRLPEAGRPLTLSAAPGPAGGPAPAGSGGAAWLPAYGYSLRPRREAGSTPQPTIMALLYTGAALLALRREEGSQ